MMKAVWKKPVILTLKEAELEWIIGPAACSGRWEWV